MKRHIHDTTHSQRRTRTRACLKNADFYVHTVWKYEADVQPFVATYRGVKVIVPCSNLCPITSEFSCHGITVSWSSSCTEGSITINNEIYKCSLDSGHGSYLEALTYLPSIEFYQLPYIVHALQKLAGSNILDVYKVKKRKCKCNVVSLINLFQNGFTI